MSNYNPFGKRFEEIEAQDLYQLRTVHEGWYVEYKRQEVNASAIAKSIAAFANTYGGWLFFGVGEKSGPENVADTFPGIAREEVDNTLQRIRQAAAQSLNPSPHFDVRTIWGPAPEIGLEEERAVICVRTPKGHAAPFIHRSGQIYRRVGDGSEPRAETDRFALDQLWARGQRVRDRCAKWIGRDLELSESEKRTPYVRIFITPDLWRDKDIWADLTTQRVRDIFADLGESGQSYSATPYDVVHTVVGGYIGRQIKNNNPDNLTSTWFLRPDLTSEVIFPLPLIEARIDEIEDKLDGYKNSCRFAEALRKYNHSNPRIIDLNFIFNGLVGLFHTQSLLDAEVKRTGSLFVKIQLINVWRTCPFLDVDAVMIEQESYGVPMCMQKKIFAPSGIEPDNFIEIPFFEEKIDPAAEKFRSAIFAFEPIAAAFGIETGFGNGADADGNYSIIHEDLWDAGTRAIHAQKLRNQRR